MNKVFIGMPVYNGERFIYKALDSLRKQTYPNWSLLISDNASEDKTAEICKKYCEMDNRIKYKRQNKNIGAPANFKYVLDKAESEYFMWAAADDLWHPDFLLSCVNLLEKNKDIGMAFSNIVNIDSFDRIIREYPSFKVFSDVGKKQRIFNYVKNPEILGKANLMYSVYRLDLCKKVWEISPLSYEVGSDMCFVLAMIGRYRLYIDERVLFQKRLVRKSDQWEFISKINITNPNRHTFSLSNFFGYIKNNVRAVRGTNYSLLVLIILIFRLPQVVLNSILNSMLILRSFVAKLLRSLLNCRYLREKY